MKLPDEWQKTLLYHVAHVQTGLSKSENRTGPSVKRPYLRVANVQDGYLDLSVVKEIDVPFHQVERFELRYGDILLTEGGDFDKLGRGCVWREEIENCVHQNHVFAVRVIDEKRILPDFLTYQVQSPHAKSYFLSCAKQTTNLASINSSQLKQLPIFLPPVEVQKQCVELLNTWNFAIEKTERLIAAKEQHYIGLISQLIIQQARFNKTWRYIPLNHIADRIQRQSDGGNYPLLTISSASGFIRQEEKYSRYMAGESAKTYTLLQHGEFAYNKGNSLRYEFGCVFQLLDYEAALVPSVYVSFRLREATCPAYIRHLLAVDYLKPQLRALVKTGVRNNGLLNIRPDEFMGTTVPCPPLAEQERIATVLDEARKEIDLLTKILIALRHQKRGLMQKLLTGEWRVPIPIQKTEVA